MTASPIIAKRLFPSGPPTLELGAYNASHRMSGSRNLYPIQLSSSVIVSSLVTEFFLKRVMGCDMVLWISAKKV